MKNRNDRKNSGSVDIYRKKDMIMMLIILLLYAIFSVISDGFFSVNTLMNLMKQSAAMAIVAFGMTFVMLTGGIDLTVGSNIALVGAAAAITMSSMQNAGVSEIPVFIVGVLVTVLLASLLGAMNGFIIGFFRVDAFIVTMAMSSVTRGVAMTILESNRVLVSNSYYNYFGQGKLFDLFPSSMILVLLSGVFAYLLLRKTTFGRRIYAVGGNPVAARASGVNIRKQLLYTYMISGIFVGLATIITVGRSRSAQPLAGIGFEFEVITAVVLGGASLTGGEGRIKGTILGIVAMAIIKTGLSMFSITPFFDYLVKGSLILAAVLLNRIGSTSKKRGKNPAVTEESEAPGTGLNTDAPSQKLPEIADAQTAIELRNITKTFPGVIALDDVSVKFERGTVHALCGENGAGKSTLVKIISGVYKPDQGDILINGEKINMHSPVESRKMGISVIYQELSVVPELNVVQNMYLGREIRKGIFLDLKKMNIGARSLLQRLNVKLNLNRKLGTYTIGQQQLVEIAKAVEDKSWLIIMDEPTSAITDADKENLFELIRNLKAKGFAIVYISHKLEEILEIADLVTVLRDGKHIATLPTDEVDEQKLIKLMIGRSLTDIFYREKNQLGNVRLEVRNLYKKGVFDPISFTVREGEVLGFSGLIGAGRTEVMRCLFGLDKPDGGEILIDGKPVTINSPVDAINQGLVMVSEDRRREGIVPLMTVRENISLTSLPRISKYSWVNEKAEKALAYKYIDELSIRTPSSEQRIGNLSGGNQQKVCVGKWLATSPRIIVMDEPTRGIDIGAKSEIHKLIAELTRQNMAIILISSEMAEIMNASDRILVLYKGVLMAEYPSNASLTQEMIMTSASGLEMDPSLTSQVVDPH